MMFKVFHQLAMEQILRQLILGMKITFVLVNAPVFKRDRLLCKHFFVVFESGVGHFSDISSLYLNHPYTNIDYEVVGNIQVFGSKTVAPIADEAPCFSGHNMDLTAPLPGARKSTSYFLYNIGDYDAKTSMQDKLDGILQDANVALEIQNEGQLCTRINDDGAPCARINNGAPPPRRYGNDLCIYDDHLPVQKVQKNNPFGKRRGQRADITKKQFLVKVPVAQEVKSKDINKKRC